MASKNTSAETKNLITILLLLFIPIIGVIIMWFESGWKLWVKILVTFLFLLFSPILFVIFYAFLFRPFAINGNAMNPTYQHREYIAAQVQNSNASIKRGDVVIYQVSPEGIDHIKRVIGIPGDNIYIVNSEIYVNGEKLDESSYLTPGTETYGGAFLQEGETVSVPENMYFVMGDNRSSSSDSRQTGFIKKQSIVAKPMFCYWNCK